MSIKNIYEGILSSTFNFLVFSIKKMLLAIIEKKSKQKCYDVYKHKMII